MSGGLRNTDPHEAEPMGCVRRRRASERSILVLISALLPGARRSVGFQNDLVARQRVGAIPPRDVIAAVMANALARLIGKNILDQGAYPLIARARVHGYRAAHGTGDAHGKLQPESSRLNASLTKRASMAPAPAVMVTPSSASTKRLNSRPSEITAPG